MISSGFLRGGGVSDALSSGIRPPVDRKGPLHYIEIFDRLTLKFLWSKFLGLSFYWLFLFQKFACGAEDLVDLKKC